MSFRRSICSSITLATSIYANIGLQRKELGDRGLQIAQVRITIITVRTPDRRKRIKMALIKDHSVSRGTTSKLIG
jgi:hypothetical protein